MKNFKLSSLFQILSVGLLASTLVFSQVKTDSEMILLRVAAVDYKGKIVENLKQEQFTVKEDGVEQEIKYFNDRQEPASVLILMDISGSAALNVRQIHARHALNFIQNNAENDYSIVAFNEKITELAGWGSSREQLTDAVNKTVEAKKIKGNTAFWDTLIYALEKFKNSRYEKKVLLIFSDGHENVSKKTFSAVKRELKKSDVSVFPVAISEELNIANPFNPAMAELDEFTRISGGKAYYPLTESHIDFVIKQIESILRAQYVIGYIPKKPQKDKDWHKIEVRISSPDKKDKNLKADVIAREGYFVEK